MKDDPKISGDLLLGASGPQRQVWLAARSPPTSPARCSPSKGETGQWWALYYGGINTVVMTKEDMAARAELLRTHAFEIAGVSCASARHSARSRRHLRRAAAWSAWRGSAGAVKYSIERNAQQARGTVICDKCAIGR